MKDLEYADALDPVGISTWDNALPGLAQFKRRGGKMLTYHGTRDPVGPTLLIERPVPYGLSLTWIFAARVCR